jgi:hypothetical protein
MLRRALLALLVLSACGDDGNAPDAGPPDAATIKGCLVLTEPQAEPGDPIDGDTWATFAMDFFADNCTRCHSTTRVGPDRNGAPDGYNWDDEPTVRDHLPEIRNVVGVTMFMPFLPPDPECSERQRLVRWIDADAP